MKKLILSCALVGGAFALQAQTEITITLDTKDLFNVDCNLLGDGAGGPAQVNKVYMHSGACSENRGSNMSQSAEDYCADQIVPFASDVWQHVVGNWGAAPQDDGVGEMTHEGDGIYSKTFIMEDYYSDPNIVSTETNSTGTTASAPLDPNNPVYLLGLVFRNEDGTASGRDQQGCQDIFVINVQGNPTVINSTDNSAADFVTFEKNSVGIEDRSIAYDLFVGPNPATDQGLVRISVLDDVKDATFSITNTIGQQVYTQAAPLKVGKNVLPFNVSELRNGIYIVNISSSKGLLMQERLIVNH
ncbi:MAG: T9SS type A sorting domain-containing protein [Flavobacteriales bacterium]